MKIGIMTFHWATNHGALLQSFALQHFLSKELPDSQVLIIDYYPQKYVPSFKRCFITKHIGAMIRNLKNLKKEKKLAPFRNKLSKTQRYFSANQLLENPIDFDLLITGSDQVWNEFFTMNGEGEKTGAYYLNFNPDAIKISYAASFGLVELKKDMADYIKPYLKKFNAISVRENSGKEILNKIDISSTIVCDPTLLLFEKDYVDFCNTNINNQKFIAKCFLRENPKETKNILKKIKEKKHIATKVFDISGETMGNWLGGIREAEFVLTNSYHCVVFSLIFHKNFAVVLEKSNLSGMNDRFFTLLKLTGLENRIVSSENDIDAIINSEIDWKIVDKTLNDFSKSSKNFLLKNLEQNENIYEVR